MCCSNGVSSWLLREKMTTPMVINNKKDWIWYMRFWKIISSARMVRRVETAAMSRSDCSRWDSRAITVDCQSWSYLSFCRRLVGEQSVEGQRATNIDFQFCQKRRVQLLDKRRRLLHLTLLNLHKCIPQDPRLVLNILQRKRCVLF